MKIKLIVLLFAIGASLSASAQKIKVVYNKETNFAQFKTFAWAPMGAVSHPMLAANVVGAVEQELKARGLRKVEINDNPGLVIKVYGSIDQDSTFYSTDPLYNATGGIPPFDPSFSGPLLEGMQFGSTSVTIHKGQLVVDLIDAAHKKLVWRGMSQENLAHNPDKLVSQVNTAITKMFKQYPVKVEG
jgi:hypothetical protein